MIDPMILFILIQALFISVGIALIDDFDGYLLLLLADIIFIFFFILFLYRPLG